jgi:putative FmdB family regulatory protein
MPIYEYLCETCQCEFEKLVIGSNDQAVQCPSCCGNQVRKLISAAAVRPQGVPSGSGGFKAPACKPSG